MFVADTGATCTMGPTIEGCTDVIYVDQNTTVWDDQELKIKAKGNFHGILKEKDRSEKKFKIKNYAFIPTLDEWMYSVIYAKKMGIKIMDEGATISLIKGKTKIKFDHVLTRFPHSKCVPTLYPTRNIARAPRKRPRKPRLL